MSDPAPVRCLEKERLLLDFTAAVSEYHRIQTAQLRSVMEGKGFQFENEVRDARMRRDNAKYAVLAHQDEHGC